MSAARRFRHFMPSLHILRRNGFSRAPAVFFIAFPAVKKRNLSFALCPRAHICVSAPCRQSHAPCPHPLPRPRLRPCPRLHPRLRTCACAYVPAPVSTPTPPRSRLRAHACAHARACARTRASAPAPAPAPTPTRPRRKRVQKKGGGKISRRLQRLSLRYM